MMPAYFYGGVRTAFLPSTATKTKNYLQLAIFKNPRIGHTRPRDQFGIGEEICHFNLTILDTIRAMHEVITHFEGKIATNCSCGGFVGAGKSENGIRG